MNAELPYLKRIATALGKLPGLGTAGSTSGGTASGNVSVNAAIDAPGIAEALDEALMTTENDAAVSAVKALADGVLAVLEDALFTGTGNDRVSLLAQIHEALPDVGYFEEDGDGNVKLKEQYGGLWTNGFLTAGGLGAQSSEGIDLARVWQDLTNDLGFDYGYYNMDTKISELHIPSLSMSKILGLGEAFEPCLKYQGTSSTAITDGGVEIPTIEGVPYPPNLVDIVTYDGDEYMWMGSAWKLMGSGGGTISSITVSVPTGLLVGGAATKTITADDTFAITLDTDYTIPLAADVAKGVSAYNRTNWDDYFGIDNDGNLYIKPIDVNTPRGLWTDGFLTAGGQGSSGSGGVDMGRVWQDLTNNQNFDYNNYSTTTKISADHIPTMYAKYQGTSTTSISDGGSETPTIDGAAHTPQLADIVSYGSNEYMWKGSAWKQLNGGIGLPDVWQSLTNGNSPVTPTTTTKIALDHIPTITNAKLANKSFRITKNSNTYVDITLGGSIASWELSEVLGLSFEPYSVLYTSAAGSTDIKGLSPNTSTTKKYLSMTGDGWNGAIPSWSTLDIPVATSSAVGGIKIGYTTSNKNYAVQLSSDKAYVNVPWTDTTYKLTLNGTANGDSSGTSLGSFYAPTSAGSSNNVLTSSGSGAPSWSSSLQLAGTLSVAGATTLSSTLSVDGDTTLKGTLTVGTSSTNCNTQLYGQLAVSGATSLSSTLGVTGATTLSSTLSVAGSTSLDSTLSVAGATTHTANVTIGTTSSNKNLYVYGLLYMGKSSTASAYIEYLTNAARLHTNVGIVSDTFITAGAAATSSDARLKKHLRDVELTVAQIAQAPAVTFDWVDESRGSGAGSIAQYWEEVLPLNVHRWGSDYLSMEYGNIALLSAITIARTVENHEERIARLEKENKELKEKLRYVAQ